MRLKATSCLVTLVLSSFLFGNSLEVHLDSIWRSNHYLDIAYDDQGYLLATSDFGVDLFVPAPDQPLQKLGSLAFEMHQPKQILTLGRYSYLLTDNALLLLDLNNRQQPQLLNELPYGGTNFQRIGQTLYIFGQTLHVLDTADPAMPTLKSQYPLAETPTYGQTMGNIFLTLTERGELRSYEIQTNNQLRQLDLVNLGTRNQNGLPELIGNRLYVAHSNYHRLSQLEIAEIASDGTLRDLGTLFPRIWIDRLGNWNGNLTVMGQDESFRGMKFFQPVAGENLLAEPTNLISGDLRTICPATDEMFFSLHKQGDIVQYNPQTSYSITTRYTGEQQVLDVAFDGSLAFLASPDSLQVLSFKDPANPSIVTTIEGLPGISQKLLFKEGELHHASQTQYRRYQVTDDGKLTLLYQHPFTIEGPILALGFEHENALVISPTQLAVLNQSPTDQFPALRILEFNGNALIGADFKDDLVIVDNTAEVKILRFTQQSGLEHLFTHRPLNQPPGLNRISAAGELLTVRNDIFDIRNPEGPKLLVATSFPFHDSSFAGDTLYGIGDQGLGIWDFGDPSRSQLQGEFRDIEGDRIFVSGQQMLVFQQQPNTLKHLTIAKNTHTWLFPMVRNDDSFDSQLNFFNSSTQTMEAQLTITDEEGTATQERLVIKPGETLIRSSEDFAPKSLAFNIKVQAPPTLVPFIGTKEFWPTDLVTNSSQTHALSSDDLTHELVFDIVNPDDDLMLGVSQADDGDPITLAIRIVGAENRPNPRMLIANGAGPIIIPVRDIFSREELGTGVSIVCQTSTDRKIGGFIFSQNISAKPGLSLSQAIGETQLNPTRLTQRDAFGDESDYQTMTATEDRLILAGPSGIRMFLTSEPNVVTEWAIPAHDVAASGDHLWLLTPGRLQCHSLLNQNIIADLEIPKSVSRISHRENYLILFGYPYDGAFLMDITNPSNPIKSHYLPADDRSIYDATILEGIVFLAGLFNIHMYDQLNQSSPRYLGTTGLSGHTSRLFVQGDRLIEGDDFAISTWNVQAGNLPVRGRGRIKNRLVDIDQDRGLLIDTETNAVSIIDLHTFFSGDPLPMTPGFIPVDGQLKGNSLWLRDEYFGIQSFDISDPAAPVLRLDFAPQVLAQHVAAEGDVTYVASMKGTEGFLNLLRVQDGELTSQTVSLGQSQPSDIATIDGFILVADKQLGLVTYLLEDGSATLINAMGHPAERVIIRDHLAFTIGENSLLDIYDVSQPMAPVHLSHQERTCCESFDTRFNRASGLHIEGDHVYVSELAVGLHIFDISQPDAPTVLASPTYNPNIFSRYSDLAIKEGYAYLANDHTVEIIDVSTPSQPNKVGEIKMEADVLTIQKDSLFIGQSNALKIYDISNPEHPVFSGEFQGINATQLEALDDTLWVATETSVERLRINQLVTTIPWAVNNSGFRTQVQITNLGSEATDLLLRAVKPDGKEITQQLTLDGRDTQNYAVGTLFPDLSGYAIMIEGPSKELSVSFATYRAAESSERAAPALAKAIPSQLYRNGLVLSFANRGATDAFVLQAPFNQGTTRVRIKLHTTSGESVEVPFELEGYRPKAMILRNLIPFDFVEAIPSVTFETEDGSPLTGMSFSFIKGEPTTSEGVGLPAHNFAP